MWSCLIHTVVAATIMGTVSAPAVAEDQVFGGKVVSVTERKLTVSDSNGQISQTFTIAEGTKVTLNGKAVALMELMAGDAVTLTIDGQKIKSVVAVRNIKVVASASSVLRLRRIGLD